MSGWHLVAGIACLLLAIAAVLVLVNAGGERIERSQRNARQGRGGGRR